MDSEHLFKSFCLLVGLVAFSILIAAVLASFHALNDALIVLLTAVVTGSFTLLSRPNNKHVTVDNPPAQPVPVEGS